ncbi:Cro/Cl family transcriptional regulator [Brachybacterium endophyticum]|uniref:Cro/Cl family transcriptional regulator n=1 Tax=Brachybacterium endophyticum TaxID=2182385 RepID=A0A2U2RKI1_9MICO|nr:sugar-binding domain-containing protein [Brachybacterium endophyticum]PWH06315.1 Cro/Cl family transcriptional regulator [Brachybacterium endophyticum]
MAADDGSLKALLATEYYLEGRSKVDIAKQHALSRFQVARLLEEARSEGIVQIRINDPADSGRDLAPLADALGISRVVVASPRVDETMRAALARQVGRLLPDLLRDGGRLGIAWSRTLVHLPDALDVLPRVDLVQLVGPLSAHGYSSAHSSALIHTLGSFTGGGIWALPTPLIVDSPEVAASLRGMDEVRSALEAADEIDVAAVSIGAWWSGASTLWSRLSEKERGRVREAGVVAECAGVLVDREGGIAHPGIEERVIGVSPEQLRRTHVVAVAPAVGHPEAVIAAARAGLVDDLVLSSELADQVARVLG